MKNASQDGQAALKEHFAVLHSETASTTQQPRGEHRGTIKDCKIAGATTWQGQGNHTFTTSGQDYIHNAQTQNHEISKRTIVAPRVYSESATHRRTSQKHRTANQCSL